MAYVFEDIGNDITLVFDHDYGLSREEFVTRLFNLMDEEIQNRLIGRVEGVVVVIDYEEDEIECLSVLVYSDPYSVDVVVELKNEHELSISRISKY